MPRSDGERERIRKGLELLREGLLPFVGQQMTDRYGLDWLERPEIGELLQKRPKRRGEDKPHLDTQALLNIIESNWKEIFRDSLGREERNLAIELLMTRNKYAHEEEFSNDDAFRALDSIGRLLTAISAPGVAEVEGMKGELLRERFFESVSPFTDASESGGELIPETGAVRIVEEPRAAGEIPSRRDREMSNRAETIAKIIEKRRPLAQKIERAEENLRDMAAALRDLEAHRNQMLARVEDRKVRGSLNEIDFVKLQLSVAAELEALAKLRVRFSRDTLNIGVVGRARQGKSRLLQSLTGLTPAEIPDGERQHCTGVRSTIRHTPNTETHAEVWFHSERSFLDEIIAPYYEKLRLGAKPISLAEFASKPLPPLPGDLTGAEVETKYEHLSRYRGNVGKYSQLLREPSPRRISRNEIREYVAQDTPDGERVYFNYLAVKEVKISCPFPNADVGQITLVDMPGLGDTGIGDEERLVRTLGQDIDAVLFVRMPRAIGDFWGDVDVRLYDTARSALAALPLELWSFMVLNRTGADSKNGDNSALCQDLASDISKKHIRVVECVTANCAGGEEANSKVLARVLDYLATHINQLDRQYASACQEGLRQLQNAVSAELEKARQALVKGLPSPNEQARFLRLFNPVLSSLSVGLVRLLKELRQERDTAEENFFKPQVEAAIETCKADTGIPSLEQIEIRHDETGSWDITYAEYLDKIRTHLTGHFGSVDTGLKQAVDAAKSRVAEVLVKAGNLGGVTPARGPEFLKVMAERVPEEEGQLKKAFQNLWNFKMSYEVNFHYRIRQHLDDLTPDSKGIELSRNASAQEILENLEQLHKEAVFKCQEALEDLYCEPRQAAFAAVEEFIDRVLRAEGAKTEWQIFLYEVRSQVWPSEFEPVGEGSDVRREWQQLVERAAAANQSEDLQFLN